MTTGNTKTSFRFKNFKVPAFSFNEPDFESKGYKMNITPEGLYDEKTGEFDVIIHFKAIDQDKDFEIVKIKAIATFEFNEAIPFSELPDYFYANSLAIAFPFLRAFASTLTLQANSDIIMLGLMNFSNLKEPLMKASKIKVIN